tara:strand:- start:451 stop:702 length:252 start_codon:yes stop_codon:yes gene_type:complete
MAFKMKRKPGEFSLFGGKVRRTVSHTEEGGKVKTFTVGDRTRTVRKNKIEGVKEVEVSKGTKSDPDNFYNTIPNIIKKRRKSI